MAPMSTFAAVDPPLDGAAGGIPFLPPLGESRQVPATAGTLARLAGDLAVAMTVETAEVEAMLVFVDREPVVAVARRGSLVTTDQDAVETVAEVPVDGLRFFRVDPALARVLGAYFLPTVVDDLSVASVAAETLIRSFGKPGQRACVIVRAAGDLGLAFLDGDADPACMTSSGEAGGLDRLAGLLSEPGARLTVRAGGAHGGVPGGTGGATPRATPRAAAPGPGLAAFLERTGGKPPETPPLPPGGGGGPPGPEGGRDVASAESADPGAVEAVVAEAEQLLGRSSARVAEALRDVKPTPEAIATAVKRLRQDGVRLVSAETMDLVVERTLAVLKARRPVRG
jgi:hypothetical protein